MGPESKTQIRATCGPDVSSGFKPSERGVKSAVNEIELKLRVDVESGPCARGGNRRLHRGPPHREGQRSAAPWKAELMDFSTKSTFL